MEIKRSEIMPGVNLAYLWTASMNALIPLVLRRGTTRYPDMEAISARLDELYGTAIEPVVRRIGEIQCLGFYASIPEEEYLPGNNGVLEQATALLGELLLSPATRGGLLLPKYVDSERESAPILSRGASKRCAATRISPSAASAALTICAP